MKRTVITTALLLALAPAASGELYKYLDQNGKTVYSDQPPMKLDSKQLKTAPPAAAPAKSAVERDKELEKTRKDVRDTQEKAEKTARNAAEQEKACMQARASYRTYSEGGRVYKIDDKGERVFMEDAEMESEKQRAKTAMDEACKKG